MSLSGSQVRLTEMERNTVKQEMRAILILCARERRLITYSDLCDEITSARLHPGSFIFTRLLREVCGDVEAEGGGILCALVVSKSTGMPGGGYFTGVAQLGRDASDLMARWQADVEEVYRLWNGE